MFIEERLQSILDIINTQERITVKELSLKFNVTEGMIRKDLQRLEKQNLIKRTYGGAISKRILISNDPFNNRLKENLTEKHIIAKKAFNELNDGDTIFLDISTTNYILANLISNSTKKLTIITNMSIIPPLFTENTHSKIIIIGGVYNSNIGGVVGAEAIKSIQKYSCNKAFIGSCGINIQNNKITNYDLEDGNTKEAIIKNSMTIYLVIENRKFNIDGTYKFAELAQIDYLITDALVDEFVKEKLQNFSIKIL